MDDELLGPEGKLLAELWLHEPEAPLREGNRDHGSRCFVLGAKPGITNDLELADYSNELSRVRGIEAWGRRAERLAPAARMHAAARPRPRVAKRNTEQEAQRNCGPGEPQDFRDERDRSPHL